MEVSCQLHAPAALPLGEIVTNIHSIRKRLNGSQSRSGRCEDNNLLPIPIIETRLHGGPACSLVAIPTELFRLPLVLRFIYIVPCRRYWTTYDHRMYNVRSLMDAKCNLLGY
jgi:hypothetical protein